MHFIPQEKIITLEKKPTNLHIQNILTNKVYFMLKIKIKLIIKLSNVPEELPQINKF